MSKLENDNPVGSWNPTPEQFSRYLQREVEMARANMKRAGAHFGSMLHSPETIARAQAKP